MTAIEVKLNMLSMTFWIFALLLACVGSLLLLKSYFSTNMTRNRKLIHEGYIGAFFLLFACGIAIYSYSRNPVPDRVLHELRGINQELDVLPEIG